MCAKVSFNIARLHLFILIIFLFIIFILFISNSDERFEFEQLFVYWTQEKLQSASCRLQIKMRHCSDEFLRKICKSLRCASTIFYVRMWIAVETSLHKQVDEAAREPDVRVDDRYICRKRIYADVPLPAPFVLSTSISRVISCFARVDTAGPRASPG